MGIWWFKLVKKEPKTSISYFGVVFGEISHLDYEPNSKLKVPQNDLLVFLDKCQ